MCELLALNANTPTDMGFSFRGLSRRGGASGEHADGWGLASFTTDGHGLTLLREEAPAAFSALADQLADRSPRALVSIAHIRKATRGVVALENCHPFSRSWGGQSWVFAHNGDLQGAIPLGDRYRPFGSTDSEAALCWILEELDRALVNTADSSALFEQLHHCAAQLAEQGIECEIIDPRTLRPLDEEMIFNSVRKTHRCVIIEEAYQAASVGSFIAEQIQRVCFDELDAPVMRVTNEFVPMPYAENLEHRVLPEPERIIPVIKEVLYMD
jgi:predicted glutamine amidotransferase